MPPLSEQYRAPQAGYLFKLKEKGGGWKKIYAVLRGCELCYYESPSDAQRKLLMRDGAKTVLSAAESDPPARARPPVHDPWYFTIQTTTARKTYCVRTSRDREKWLGAISTAALRGQASAPRAAPVGAASSTWAAIGDTASSTRNVISGLFGGGKSSRNSKGHGAAEEAIRAEQAIDAAFEAVDDEAVDGMADGTGQEAGQTEWPWPFVAVIVVDRG